MTPKRVVIVEDDPELCEMLVMAVEDAGYAVNGFGDGADALTQVQAVGPDLIILDMLMPHARVDGFEFLARMSTGPSSTIPVVVLSGLGGEISEALAPDLAERLRIVAVVRKPVSFSDLLDQLHEVIGEETPARPRDDCRGAE